MDTGGGCWGNAQRNVGLDLAKGDYVYFLDDDNVIHPRLLELLPTLRGEVAMVEQVFADGSPRVGVDWRPGELCDTAQFLVPRQIAQSYRWDPRYRESDIIYFTSIHRDHHERFLRIAEPAAYYNFLRH